MVILLKSLKVSGPGRVRGACGIPCCIGPSFKRLVSQHRRLRRVGNFRVPQLRELPKRFPSIQRALLSVNVLGVLGEQVVMNGPEAAGLASLLGAEVAVPKHDRFKGSWFTDNFILSYFGTPVRFQDAAKKVAAATQERVLEPGEVLNLSRLGAEPAGEAGSGRDQGVTELLFDDLPVPHADQPLQTHRRRSQSGRQPPLSIACWQMAPGVVIHTSPRSRAAATCCSARRRWRSR